jgi:hypothetical protein
MEIVVTPSQHSGPCLVPQSTMMFHWKDEENTRDEVLLWLLHTSSISLWGVCLAMIIRIPFPKWIWADRPQIFSHNGQNKYMHKSEWMNYNRARSILSLDYRLWWSNVLASTSIIALCISVFCNGKGDRENEWIWWLSIGWSKLLRLWQR